MLRRNFFAAFVGFLVAPFVFLKTKIWGNESQELPIESQTIEPLVKSEIDYIKFEDQPFRKEQNYEKYFDNNYQGEPRPSGAINNYCYLNDSKVAFIEYDDGTKEWWIKEDYDKFELMRYKLSSFNKNISNNRPSLSFIDYPPFDCGRWRIGNELLTADNKENLLSLLPEELQ